MNWLKLISILFIGQLSAQLPALDLQQDTLFLINEGKLESKTGEVFSQRRATLYSKEIQVPPKTSYLR